VRDFFQSSSEFKQYAQLLFLIHLHFQSSSEFKVRIRHTYCRFHYDLSILFWV